MRYTICQICLHYVADMLLFGIQLMSDCVIKMKLRLCQSVLFSDGYEISVYAGYRQTVQHSIFRKTLYPLYSKLSLSQVIREQTLTLYCCSRYSCSPIRNSSTVPALVTKAIIKYCFSSLFITYHDQWLLRRKNNSNFFYNFKVKG